MPGENVFICRILRIDHVLPLGMCTGKTFFPIRECWFVVDCRRLMIYFHAGLRCGRHVHHGFSDGTLEVG